MADEANSQADTPCRGGASSRDRFPWFGLFLFLPTLAAPFTWHYAPFATFAGLLLSHAALCYGTLRANCQWFGPVATRFVPDGDEVWLTIDDGPHPEDTPALLDLLDMHGARATFFVCGARAAAHPELIREIIRRGHGVANHTYTHPQFSFWCASPWRAAAEIDRCSALLQEIIGEPVRWFRAPVGMANPFVHLAVGKRGLRLAGWSTRGLDTFKSATPRTVVDRILNGLQPGAIILLHEGREMAAGGRLNVEAMALLLSMLTVRRWRAVIPDDARLRT